MTVWTERSIEERNLLNPGFCAMLLWHAARSYNSQRSNTMAIELSFLVLPFTLHKDTRESLPTSVKTSLPTWLSENPLVQARFGQRASMLCAFTKDALFFGGSRQLLMFANGGVRANEKMKPRVRAFVQIASREVDECAERAEFLGKWLERSGGPEIVLALLGVRP